ncbi:endonuclease [soil metagenome]
MKITIQLLFCLFIAGCLSAQRLPKPTARIAFWNVENFYDTINDPAIDDEEFLPGGKMKWTSERYNAKLKNLSKVILAMGNGTGPDILGMAEVENRNVLVDLTTKTDLAKQKYGIVHFDSHDKRGIDVAMIYKKKKFKVLEAKTIFVPMPSDSSFTRDILLVKGVLGKKDTLYIFVNHWPSRRGGEEASAGRRMIAAQKLRNAEDSILKIFPNAKILAMGDFNDEPDDKSIQSLKSASGSETGFVDLMDSLKAAGDGSYHYKKEKNMLDQILVSPNLHNGKGLYVYHASIFREAWMTGENYKGDPPGPLHVYAGSRYIGGYSDHYPVYADVYVVK